jgi:hypothetical protein
MYHFVSVIFSIFHTKKIRMKYQETDGAFLQIFARSLIFTCIEKRREFAGFDEVAYPPIVHVRWLSDQPLRRPRQPLLHQMSLDPTQLVSHLELQLGWRWRIVLYEAERRNRAREK